MHFADKSFSNEVVELDGNSYHSCTFNDVVFHYSGKDVEMADCRFGRFSFRFGGDLAGGLYTLYQLFGTEGMLSILRGFTQPQTGEIEIDLTNKT